MRRSCEEARVAGRDGRSYRDGDDGLHGRWMEGKERQTGCRTCINKHHDAPLGTTRGRASVRACATCLDGFLRRCRGGKGVGVSLARCKRRRSAPARPHVLLDAQKLISQRGAVPPQEAVRFERVTLAAAGKLFVSARMKREVGSIVGRCRSTSFKLQTTLKRSIVKLRDVVRRQPRPRAGLDRRGGRGGPGAPRVCPAGLHRHDG